MFRFSLATLMLLMLIASVMGAGLFYLVRAIQHDAENLRGIGVIIVLVSPVALLIVMSLIWQAMRFFSDRDEEE